MQAIALRDAVLAAAHVGCAGNERIRKEHRRRGCGGRTIVGSCRDREVVSQLARRVEQPEASAADDEDRANHDADDQADINLPARRGGRLAAVARRIAWITWWEALRRWPILRVLRRIARLGSAGSAITGARGGRAQGRVAALLRVKRAA